MINKVIIKMNIPTNGSNRLAEAISLPPVCLGFSFGVGSGAVETTTSISADGGVRLLAGRSVDFDLVSTNEVWYFFLRSPPKPF